MHVFVRDDALDYGRFATHFARGDRLVMDEAYCRAHLPLVAPDHSRVIREDVARGYRMGRHETAWSLVIPVDWRDLSNSPAFVGIQSALRASPIAGKIDWTSHLARRDVLHATICGGLARGAPPVISDESRAVLRGQTPFACSLRGVFSGNVNLGRLYLKLYPEARDGANTVHALQRALGRPETGLYVVGLHNLVDDLDEKETAWLAEFLARHREDELLTFTVEYLHLLGARDDLALDSVVAERLRLG